MKKKNKLTRRITAIVALIALITIFGSGILNNVQANTSQMSKNNNNLQIYDFYENEVNINANIGHHFLKDLIPVEDELFTMPGNGINYEKVNMANQKTSDSKYGFSFTLSENTKMEVWKDGFTNSIEYKKLRGTEKENECKDIVFFPTNYNQSGKFGVYIYNAGLYMYTDSKTKEEKICNIGLKLTFSWEDWKVDGVQQFPFINVRTYSEGSKQYGLFFSFTNMSYATNIEIFEGDPKNGTKRNIDMNMTLIDIDDRQFFGVGKFNNEGEDGLKNHINKIQFTNDSNVFSDNMPNNHYQDYVWFYANNDTTTNHTNVIQDSVRLELKDVNSFSFVTGTKHDPCSYHYGNRYYLNSEDGEQFYSQVDYAAKMAKDGDKSIEKKIKKYIGAIEDELLNNATYPTFAMVGYFKNEPFYTYDLSKPIERVNDNKPNQDLTSNEIGKAEPYTYKIYHYIPNAANGLNTAVGSEPGKDPLLTQTQYLKDYIFTTNIPSEVDHKVTTADKKTVKIYKLTVDKDGKEQQDEVTEKFNINDTGTKITATAKLDEFEIIDPADPEKKKKINEFYNNTYLFTIDVEEKSFNKSSNIAEKDNIKTYTVNHFSSISGTSKIDTVKLTTQETNPVETNYKEIKIPITKVWNDNSNVAKLRPAEVTFNVKNPAGTTVSTKTINANTNSVYSDFIPLRNANEEIIAYTVDEQPVTNYSKKIEYTKNNGQITKATITNTLSASFKITTRVDGTGGTISGSGQNPYETVEAGKNSTKDITITPNSGYQIKSITINGKTQQLPTNVKNPYSLNKFTNMYEDKEVVVQFEPIPKATGIVNYYLKGTEQKIKESKNLTNLTIGSNLSAETYKENIQHYTYDSAIPSSITVNEESRKNVLNLYYTLTPYEYSVRYYYDGVEDESAIEKGTAEFGKQITTYKDKSRNGTYELDSENTNKTVPLTIKETNNVMKIYYVKKPEEPTTYTYSVEYFYDTVKDDSATETGSAKLGDKITTYKDKSRNGTYELDSENTNKTVPLTIKETNNVMKIYYVKKPEEPNSVNYTIYYYYDGVKDETATETGSAKLNTEITYTEKNKNGTYKLVNVDSTSGKIKITEDKDKNIINVYYEKIKEETTDAKITTKYIDKDTGEEIAESKTENTKIGEKYNTEKKDIENYSYVSDSGNTSGTVNDSEIEVIYYYEPIREIIVKYVDKQTGKEIADSSTNNGKTGDKFDITSKKQEINGYTLIEEPTEKEATYGKDSQTFTYYYAKNSKIIVRYVDEDTGEQIEKEIEQTGIVGQKYDISDTEKNISNYYLVKRPDSLTGKYTEDEQIFTFYYRKDPGLANKPIPKTGMNEIIRNTSIVALLLVILNGLRVFVRYKNEEKRSIK